MKGWTQVSAILLLAGAAIAVAAMVRGAGGFSWNWFYPWVLLPYLLMSACVWLPRHPSRARARAGVIASLLVLAFSAWFYINAMWLSSSSTAALVFVFAPAWLTLGGLVIWGLAWWLGTLWNPRGPSTP